MITVEEALNAAWTHCAPGRSKSLDFPTGFWPDIARVACHMMEQGTINPVLPFRPTMCVSGNAPVPPVRKERKRIARTIRRKIEESENPDVKVALADLLAKTARI